MKYRTKPVEIDAVQLTWPNWSEICEFVPQPWFKCGCYVDANGKETTDSNGRIGLKMRTLESQEFLAVDGDYIIRGLKGEFYPCKPDIFELKYEPVTK